MNEQRTDAQWEIVEELRARGGRDVFDDAVARLGDPDPRQRAFGVDVLAKIGPWCDQGAEEPAALDRQPYHEEVVPLLLDLLARERDAQVLASLGYGLGHHDDEHAVAPLVALRDHPDLTVRHAVVDGLAERDDDRALAALIELSADEDEVIRDWATFALGRTDRDTPALRAALLARLEDPDEETRKEAAAGLARRDPELRDRS